MSDHPNNHNKLYTENSLLELLTGVTSFIGSKIANPYSEDAEKPPKEAKHVVTLTWSWSPVHSRTSEYRISSRDGYWDLYELDTDSDTGRKLSSRIASGSSNGKNIDASDAARCLLFSALKSEIALDGLDVTKCKVDRASLLKVIDIDQIIGLIKISTLDGNSLFTHLIWLFKSKENTELESVWQSLQHDGRVKLTQETEVPNSEEFYENQGGIFHTWHSLYIYESLVHTWRMDWNGTFKTDLSGERVWVSLYNEYADDYGGDHGFGDNGDMYLFLEALGVFALYKHPDVPEATE
jgi:hypothetical protein